MEALECIKTRADIRAYLEKDVDQELVKKVLEAAIQAPSSGNLQDWEFIVVRREDLKKALVGAALGQDFIANAPVVIVVCSNLERIARYGERGRSLYSIQNTAAAIQNLNLAAHDLGLATCWVGAFNEQEVKRILNIPQHVRPLAIIPLGWPSEKVKKPERMALEKVMHKEVWGGR